MSIKNYWINKSEHLEEEREGYKRRKREKKREREIGGREGVIKLCRLTNLITYTKLPEQINNKKMRPSNKRILLLQSVQ